MDPLEETAEAMTSAASAADGTPVTIDAVGVASRAATRSDGNARPDMRAGAPTPRGPGLISRLQARVMRAGRVHRPAAAADAERERIAQDLHDGLQQHLTALRIQLGLAADRFAARSDPEASSALEGFGDDVERAIGELRDLAQGIYPALLTTEGLGAALDCAGRHAAQRVTVRVRAGRYSPAVERAVYFSCLAAIDNAAKHAGPADTTVEVVGTTQGLRFTVTDSGTGFDLSRVRRGAGIANMRDRVSAVGGTLTIDSTPGHGTRVQGDVPHLG
jgi:signal transduction histidine kinase